MKLVRDIIKENAQSQQKPARQEPLYLRYDQRIDRPPAATQS